MGSIFEHFETQNDPKILLKKTDMFDSVFWYMLVVFGHLFFPDRARAQGSLCPPSGFQGAGVVAKGVAGYPWPLKCVRICRYLSCSAHDLALEW